MDRTASRDGRPEEVGVPEGRRRREFEGSRGEAMVDIVAASVERVERTAMSKAKAQGRVEVHGDGHAMLQLGWAGATTRGQGS